MRTKQIRVTAAGVALAGLVGLGLLAAPSSAAVPRAASVQLASVTASGFGAVLSDGAHGGTLYVLSDERATSLRCTGACLHTWHPLLVATATKSVPKTSAVKGKVGFVTRSATTKQVTFNGFPLYTYVGDTTATAIKGAALTGEGGRWYLVHPGAVSAGATASLPTLQVGAASSTYSGILEAGTSSFSLYLLSAESNGTLHCTGSCLQAWPPLLVPSGTKSIALGAGVNGTIGFVTRGSQKQVTFNGYPVYTFSQDPGPNQATGEGIKSDGGTWELVHAGATTKSATPFAPR